MVVEGIGRIKNEFERMNYICVLSLAGINDSRARRTISSMANENVTIDYFFIGDEIDELNLLVNDKINLYPIKRPKLSIKGKIINHSLVYLASMFLIPKVREIRKSYDVIYAHDLPTSYAAYKLRTIATKIIYDVHDLYVETLNQHFPSEVSFLKKIIFKTLLIQMRFFSKLWERKFIKSVDLILTTNENYKLYLKENYNVSNIIITPNYPEHCELQKTMDIYEDFDIEKNKIIVLYHGALNEGRYLREIVRSSEHFDENIILIIIGNGPLENELKNLNSIAKNKIHFKNLLPYENLLSYISGASIGLMLIKHINLSKKYALANKVTEYMAAGICVLGSNSPENSKIISKYNSGKTMDLINEYSIANEINNLAKSRSELDKLGVNGRLAFEKSLNWNIVKTDFENRFNQLIKK